MSLTITPADGKIVGWVKLLTYGFMALVLITFYGILVHLFMLPVGVIAVTVGLIMEWFVKAWERLCDLWEQARDSINYVNRKRE